MAPSAPWEDPWDDQDLDTDDNEKPRTGTRWTTVVAWIAIAAMVLMPMMSLLNLYRAEPLLVIAAISLVGAAIYLVSTRSGDLIARINERFKR
ncbi:hypothetical protein IEU95_07205 [Hoyosella rhizosphaerae]|uniref:Uncharacterized protein n=1 Tax=Hoyosella rhizosphaerae TaxID=1755582 RepID=A0A916U360_9ACTN|nr:hypothetical protein [Hoyosella rhizosphaerae]MBN4926610.1 hypothetical protein [Hoyosella rhizosphaerae]GGC57928.1 hypothetical protein GCM10011410_07980 [Hoyosella rhizosphaerae]